MTALERIASPFDALVSRLTDQAARREDVYQDAVSAALDLTDLDTRLRFCLGDLTCLIVGRYGADTMGDWAASIKRAKSTCYQYASVARYYPLPMRLMWLEEPALSYTHMRLAMSAGALEGALDWLHRAAGGAWSCDTLAYEMSTRVDISRAPKLTGQVTFRCEHGAWVMDGLEGLREGVMYKVTCEEMA